MINKRNKRILKLKFLLAKILKLLKKSLFILEDHARSSYLENVFADVQLIMTSHWSNTNAKWFDWPCQVRVIHQKKDSNFFFFFKIAEPLKLEIPIASYIFVEFITDNKTENDGNGFRLQWECKPYDTIII